MSLFNNVIGADGSIVGMKSSGGGGGVMESIRRSNDPYEKIIDLLPRLSIEHHAADFRFEMKDKGPGLGSIFPITGFKPNNGYDSWNDGLMNGPFACSMGNKSSGGGPSLMPTPQAIITADNTGIKDHRFPIQMTSPGDEVIITDGKIAITSLNIQIKTDSNIGGGTWHISLHRSKTVDGKLCCDVNSQIGTTFSIAAGITNLTGISTFGAFTVTPGEVLWLRITHTAMTSTNSIYTYCDPMSVANFYHNPDIMNRRLVNNYTVQATQVKIAAEDPTAYKTIPCGLAYGMGRNIEFLQTELYFNGVKQEYDMTALRNSMGVMSIVSLITYNLTKAVVLSKYSIYLDLDRYNITELKKIEFSYTGTTAGEKVIISIVDRFDKVLFADIQSGEDLTSKELPARYSIKVTFVRTAAGNNVLLKSLKIHTTKLNSDLKKSLYAQYSAASLTFPIHRVRGMGILRSIKVPDGYPATNNNINRTYVVIDGKIYNFAQLFERYSQSPASGNAIGATNVNLVFYRTFELWASYQQTAGDYDYLTAILSMFEVDFFED